jgi:hypothetical protein
MIKGVGWGVKGCSDTGGGPTGDALEEDGVDLTWPVSLRTPLFWDSDGVILGPRSEPAAGGQSGIIW